MRWKVCVTHNLENICVYIYMHIYILLRNYELYKAKSWGKEVKKSPCLKTCEICYSISQCNNTSIWYIHKWSVSKVKLWWFDYFKKYFPSHLQLLHLLEYERKVGFGTLPEILKPRGSFRTIFAPNPLVWCELSAELILWPVCVHVCVCFNE